MLLSTKMIGNKITEARKRMGISQARLAELMFISPQAVGKWERGESMPDITAFSRLAEILGVDLNYFSGSFQSAANGIEPVDSSVGRSAELPSEKQKNELRWDMSRGNWVDADFSGLKNLHEKFSSSNMQRCKFTGSGMSGLLLKNNHVDSCDFSGSDIGGSHIQGSYLVNSILADCSLKDAEFAGSYIKGCDFSGVDLTGAVIKAGGFQANKMADTVLDRTSFNATHIADIVFDGILEDCCFENCTFSKVTFQNSRLTNTFF